MEFSDISRPENDWPSLILQKQAQREAGIPKEWRLPETLTSQANRDSTASALDILGKTTILTNREQEITESYDATGILHKLANGSFTSLEVTTAFCKRAAIAHQLINPLTEIFFDKALKRAEECDAFLARTGRLIGPFHGLPVSLKDVFMIKGEFSSVGFVSYLNKPAADYNSAIVDVLYNGGAVFYCKTTVPQGLFAVDGENRVFGCTLNPQRLCLTPGGSSSGEGALVGFRGSPLGIGTDLGGSVRCPAFLNGCYGFKPTSNRLPFGGQQFHFPDGWPGVIPAAGPIANSARDLILLCKNVIQGGGWKHDPTAAYRPWRDVPRKEKLRVGIWMGLEEAHLHLTVLRTLKTAQKALRADHEIVPVVTPEASDFPDVIKTYITSLKLDANDTFMGHVDAGGEELLPALAASREAIANLPAVTLDDVVAVNIQRGRMAAGWHAVLKDLDVMLCPAHHSPGARHGMYGIPANTLIWNLLDCPAAVIPFLKSDEKVDTNDDVEVESFHGVSSHLQLVGWMGQDEEILMATEVISDALARYGAT